MGFWFYLLMAICAISAFFIIITVMMQPSKDGGLGGLGGGVGGGDSVLGANRNIVLSKATWVLMTIFLVSSILLGMITSRTIAAKEKEKNTKSTLEESLSAPKEKEVTTPKAEPKTDKKEAPVAPNTNNNPVVPATKPEPGKEK